MSTDKDTEQTMSDFENEAGVKLIASNGFWTFKSDTGWMVFEGTSQLLMFIAGFHFGKAKQ